MKSPDGLICLGALLLVVTLITSPLFGAPSVLHFSDLTWGPKTGWENSSYKGAAITVWGQNFGSQRGSNYVTVNGAQLTADTDYAEWGAVGPGRGLQRVTFWLNSNCADGAGSITVTVNGMTSNAIPFNVAPGSIYFISVTDGNNSNNGLYSSAQGGANGPFKDLYMFSFQHNPSGDGQYIAYVRGGTYTAQDTSGDGTIISYRGPSGGATKQKALVGYPTETPVIDATAVTHGVVWNADYSPYGRNSYLTYSKLTVANGTEAFYAYGDYIRVIGNHFQNMLEPVWSGIVFVANSQYTKIYGNLYEHCGATTDGSYKHHIYLITETLSEIVTNQYSDIGWNEFANPESGSDNRGGVIFARTDGSVSSTIQTQNFYIHDNYFHGGNQNFIEIGDGPPQKNIWIYNNIFTGGSSVDSPISLAWTTANGNLYNNSFYLAGTPSVSIVDVVGITPLGSQMNSANNIFYASRGQDFFLVESGSTMSSDHDLFFSAGGAPMLPSGGDGLTLTNPSFGDPLFVNAPNNDFHLHYTSPAIDTGTGSVSSFVTGDFDGISRPQNGKYDVGAFEYPLGDALPQPSISVTIEPAAIILRQARRRQFTAVVAGTRNTAVTWTLKPALGTLSASGLYTPPTSITTPQSVEVTATAAADSTKSASATVTLCPSLSQRAKRAIDAFRAQCFSPISR